MSITLTAHVSKGTYIRSLARDIARALGTVGHVTMLRRLRAGPFDLSHAISLDKLNEVGKGAGLENILLPLEAGLDDIPALTLSPEQASAVRQGRVLTGLAFHDGLYWARAGNVPLALIDAPTQGTGKGLLSDLVSIIATGNSAAILTMSDSEEELQKLITALLIEGTSIITIDNIAVRLQSRHLDAMLTSDMWRGRILGVSKTTLVPQRATWIATGNNIKLGGDLARRCYHIRHASLL